MLKVTKLSKVFQSGEDKVMAVDDVSFELKTGVFSAVVGKSGSGKSTLLALLGALDRPSGGTIEVDGDDITKLGQRALTNYRCAKIGFIFQAYNLIPNLNALDNVMLPMELAHLPKSQRLARAQKLLNQVGIDEEKQKRKPTRLSGGEQQRVAIARALGNKPKLILADEPTGNLDSKTGKLIIDLMHDLAKSEDVTIIAVTHDLALARQAHTTFRIKDGRLAS